MKSRIIFLLTFCFVFPEVYSQNPIVPAGVYIADPSAHVWKDGKMYIYGSNDESRDYWCSYVHHVLSSADLQQWDLTRDVFASRGPGDQVPYNDNLLFAPDCAYKNGTYYLYYCQPSNTEAEGVATSQSPLGPFVNGRKMETGGISEIDPCVFVDDDGQAYYIWGQFTAKVARLKSNMTEIDLSTIKDSVVTEKEHYFHEGGYMVKRNGIYYFIYTHMGRANRPTCIGYSTAKSPFGPFKYGGVIIDNSHCDPSVWNNHGSIVEFNGKWNVFYHRSTHNSQMMRKACVEPISFNPDGSINEVEMTSQGAGRPLKATFQIEAERACLLFGNTRIRAFSANGEELGGIRNKDNVAYKYLDFGEGVDEFDIRVAPGKKGGSIQLALDQPWHPAIGTVEIKPGNGEKDWQTFSCKVKKTSGVHALWLRFSGETDTDLFDVDWFKFSSSTP